ncbi:MAG: hypothetical protein Q9216_003155 [Gyalolechia sp. 2 TL-2023]
MGSEHYPLRTSGIYRNLPTFDPSLKDLKAIVVGATGISGFNTIRSLLDTPDRWSTIYALSRHPPSSAMMSLLTPEQRPRIKHVPIDLTSSGAEIASSLKRADVEADHVFFYGYQHPQGMSAMDPATADALVEINVPIFRNFLDALALARIQPKRILLQTGGKNYGGHIGRARTPYIESDPQPKHLSNNFYYPQEDALFAFCQEHPGTGWNVIRPFAIVGAVPNAAMNFFLSFAVMAAVQSKKGKPIFFGGDIEEWQYEMCHSTARLTGYLSEWAVLEDKCKNQSFNAQDGSPLSLDRFFEELARWYDVKNGIEGPELDESKFQTIKLAGGKDSPLGYGPPPATKVSRSIADWAKEPANEGAWKEIMAESNGQVRTNVFEAGVDFSLGDFLLHRIGHPSVAKLRRFGFNGFVDTMESVFEMYQEMAKLGVIPPPVVDAARPMI